jgi:hypothetical protein
MRGFCNGTGIEGVHQIALKARFNPSTDVEYIVGADNVPAWLIPNEAVWVIFPDSTNVDSTDESVEDSFNKVQDKFRTVYGDKGVVADFDVDDDHVSATLFSKLIKGRYAFDTL